MEIYIYLAHLGPGWRVDSEEARALLPEGYEWTGVGHDGAWAAQPLNH